MFNLKTSAQIRTHRNAKSFRSCRYAAGSSQKSPDRGRVQFEEARRLGREAWRLRLNCRCNEHQRKARTACRVPWLFPLSGIIKPRCGLIELSQAKHGERVS